MEKDFYDFIVIGGGPHGIYCADQIKRRFKNKKSLLLEKGRIGNNISSYPDVKWHSPFKDLKLSGDMTNFYSDSLRPTSLQFVEYLNNYTKNSNINYRENSNVVAIKKSYKNDNYLIKVISQEGKIWLEASYVIFCTGTYDNKYIYNANYEYIKYNLDLNLEGQKVVLVGGGPSSADFVYYNLERNHITWITRGQYQPIFENMESDFMETIKKYEKNICFKPGVQISDFAEDRTIYLSTGEVIKGFDTCYSFLGFSSKNELFHKMALNYKQDCLELSENYETSMRNIYAFGSIMSRWIGHRERIIVNNANPYLLTKILNSIQSRIKV